MAQTTLQGPNENHRGPNLGDETPERGWSFKHIIDTINTMFTEIYALAGAGYDAAVAQAAAAAALAHVPVVGTVGEVREIIGAGAPDATARAALTVNPTGDDNGLIFTAVAYGSGGNAISVTYRDPAANNAGLSVGVVGNAITVNLATGVAGAITSTAAAVKAAIVASVPASALVTVADYTGDTNYVGGAGVVTAKALANLANGTGVGIGVAGIGSRYTNITAGDLFINTGTKAVPVWTKLATV